MTRVDVTTVIVNWNGGDLLLWCLASLSASEFAVTSVVLVDNASSDGSTERGVARCGDLGIAVEVISNPENRGFAVACNQGMRRALEAGADFVFLLNNDASVRPDTIRRLVDAADRNPDAGLLAGKIIFPSAKTESQSSPRIWCAGVDVGFFPNIQRLRGRGECDRSGRYADERPVDALTGCGLLIRREVLERVGLFDEDYFVYVEDLDLSTRTRRAGFTCLYVPDAVMEHRASSSTGGGYAAWRKYMVAYGVVLYLRKLGTLRLWTAFLLIDMLGWPVLFVLSVFTSRRRGVLAKGCGMIDALLRRPARPGRLTPAP